MSKTEADFHPQNNEFFWQQLRHHIEWTEGFGLFFYFSDDLDLIKLLEMRLEKLMRGRTTRLQKFYYEPAQEHWLQNTLEHLLSRDEEWKKLHSPAWLNLSQFGGEKAYTDYFKLLQRLNERRDLLRKHYDEVIILLFPAGFQNQCRLAAPDLWSISSFSETILPKQVTHSPSQSSSIADHGNDIELSKKGSEYLERLLGEWQRLNRNEQLSDKFGKVVLAQRLAYELLKFGRTDEATDVIQQAVELSEQLEDERELSVCLNILGDIAKQQGRWNDAQTSFEESLDIRRRLAKILGETPEALRDICVSLYKNGLLAVEQSFWERARTFFEEGREIGSRLEAMLPDLPEYNSLQQYFNQQLANLSDL